METNESTMKSNNGVATPRQLTKQAFENKYEQRGWGGDRGYIGGFLSLDGQFFPNMRKVMFVRGLAFVSVGGKRCPVFENNTGTFEDLPVVGKIKGIIQHKMRTEFIWNTNNEPRI